MNKSDLLRRINASSSLELTGVSRTTLGLAEIILSREKNTRATQYGFIFHCRRKQYRIRD